MKVKQPPEKQTTVPATTEKRRLPSIDELYANKEMSVQLNDLNKLLNAQPKNDWLYDHPIAKKKIIDEAGRKMEVPCVYIPIERVEWLLTTIFISWNVIIKEVKLIANSVVVTITLRYLNPVTGEWEFQDGIGAVALQTDKDAGATDFDRIKSNAVQIGAPAAESYAIKDAAEKIGKLFGKDLNRADQIYYNNLDSKFNADTPLNS